MLLINRIAELWQILMSLSCVLKLVSSFRLSTLSCLPRFKSFIPNIFINAGWQLNNKIEAGQALREDAPDVRKEIDEHEPKENGQANGQPPPYKQQRHEGQKLSPTLYHLENFRQLTAKFCNVAWPCGDLRSFLIFDFWRWKKTPLKNFNWIMTSVSNLILR